ncbi:MAG TPA: DUF192 domain-containing protein [Candidatus Baltobacteraceae bacterium]
MKPYVLRNVSNGALVARRLQRASNAWERGIGLLMRSSVAPDEGLWIDGCSAIHTMMMRASIDVFFLDRDGRVLRIANAVAPNRPMLACRDAAVVVELGAHRTGARDVLVGDRLVLE